MIFGTVFGAVIEGEIRECKSCHNVETFEAKNHNFTCIECHILPRDRSEFSHDDIISHPTSDRYADEFCGRCHKKEIDKFRASNHYTHQNEINLVFATFGLDRNYTLQNLPSPPDKIQTKEQLLTDMLRRKCLKCHTENSSDYDSGTHHGKGCMACHIEYANNGVYSGKDKKMRGKKPFAKTHKMSKPKDKNCLACHNKSFVGLEYFGLFPKDYDKSYRAPLRSDGKYPVQIYGADYHHLSSDVHYEAGLSCVDCHKGVMSGEKVRCESCHEDSLYGFMSDEFSENLDTKSFKEIFFGSDFFDRDGVSGDAKEEAVRDGEASMIKDGQALSLKFAEMPKKEEICRKLEKFGDKMLFNDEAFYDKMLNVAVPLDDRMLCKKEAQFGKEALSKFESEFFINGDFEGFSQRSDGFGYEDLSQDAVNLSQNTFNTANSGVNSYEKSLNSKQKISQPKNINSHQKGVNLSQKIPNLSPKNHVYHNKTTPNTRQKSLNFTYAHAPYHANLTCFSCHASWQMSNYELSLLRDDTPNYAQWASLTHQEDGYLRRFLTYALEHNNTTPKMPDFLNGELKEGVWYSGFRFRRWEHLLLGNDEEGRVAILRPFFQYRISYKNSRGEMVFDDFDAEAGQKFEAFVPFSPHTIGKFTKSCEKCHENSLQKAELSGMGVMELFKGRILKGSNLTPAQLERLDSQKYRKIRAKMLFSYEMQ